MCTPLKLADGCRVGGSPSLPQRAAVEDTLRGLSHDGSRVYLITISQPRHERVHQVESRDRPDAGYLPMADGVCAGIASGRDRRSFCDTFGAVKRTYTAAVIAARAHASWWP